MNRNTWIVVIVILAAWEAICRLQWVPGVILPDPPVTVYLLLIGECGHVLKRAWEQDNDKMTTLWEIGQHGAVSGGAGHGERWRWRSLDVDQ